MSPAAKAVIRLSSSHSVIGLDGLVDEQRIDAMATQKIQALSPQINVDDLGAWRLLIKLAYNSGTHLGIAKRVISYPSDHEKQWSLCIPVPNHRQTSYGLADKHFIPHGWVMSHDLFHPLDPQFERYTDLQSCLEDNVLRTLEAAFAIGITVAGKRIRSKSDS